jgi:hypothetical protein
MASPLTMRVVRGPTSQATAVHRDGRDRHLDALRGIAICSMIVVHVEVFSWLNLLAWERLGLVSSAEVFVALSGVVIGMVHRRAAAQGQPLRQSVVRVLDRAWQLYCVSVCVSGSLLALRLVPGVNTVPLTTFNDAGANVVYPLFPDVSARWVDQVGAVLLLRATPHQFQVIGLYVVLLTMVAGALVLLRAGRTRTLLAISWVMYVKELAYPATAPLLGFQFEYAFPILTWQVVIVHGVAAGYHREPLERWVSARKRLVIGVAACVCLACCLLAQANPNPYAPDWARLGWVSPDKFWELYDSYFTKKTLGLGRLVNCAAGLLVAYAAMTRVWPRAEGVAWAFLTSLGQASLYAFVMHIYVVLAIMSIPGVANGVPRYGAGDPWLNTVAHLSAIGIVWVMVRRRVLFAWIPR